MDPLSVSESEAQRNATLLAVADAVCLRRDPDPLFRELFPLLQAVLSFNILTFALYDSTRNTMKLYLWESAQGLQGPFEVSVERSAVGAVWRNQTVISTEDLSEEKQFKPELDRLRERHMCSYCVFPLTDFHEKLGAIGLASQQTLAFAKRDLELLHHVSEMVALAVDSALSDATLADEVGRLRLLLQVGGPEARSSDLEHSVASILGFIQEWAAQDYVGVYLYDESSQTLRLRMSDPTLTNKLAPQGLTPLQGTLAGQAFRSGQTLVFDQAALAGSPLDSVKRSVELGVRSIYLSPIPSSKGPLGVLKVARRADEGFSARDIELLEKVTATAGPVLEQAGTTLPAHQTNARILDSRAPIFFSAPEALMQSEELLTAYFKATKVGLCILDSDFRYLSINETMAQMNGVPVTGHRGKTVRDVLGDFAQLVEPEFHRVFRSGEPVLDLEISFSLPTRAEPGHWIEHYIPIKDSTGVVKQIGVIAVEVTEQKKLEDSLRGISETLRQEKKRQQVLLEVSRLLASNLDVQQAFPRISAHLRRVLRQEYASLTMHEQEGGRLVPRATDFPLGRSLQVGDQIGAPSGPGGKAIQERAPVIVTRDDMQRFGTEFAASLSSEGLKSLCCVPLLRPKGPLGVLALGSTRADAFHNDDLTLLDQVAAQLAIALENASTAREVERLKRRLKQEKRHLEGEPRTHAHFEGIIGESPVLLQVLNQVSIVAPSDATVLILGETGTGKGLVARAIHRAGRRSDRDFVSLNCAAIPTGLLESELFGHEKGAFTGAVNQKIGRLELADQGTLFLDEIGETPLELQPKLLRFLQDHEFERLGGTRTFKVDIRLIAATNRDLAKSVALREFRSDLYYRLKVFPIRLPSLRERREDIPLLVRYFVRKFSRLLGRQIETIPNETMDALVRWHWPGNIRELENFIERSVILTDGSALRAPLAEFHMETNDSVDPSLEETERDAIIRVLRETRGVLSGPTGAASRLGLKRTTLQSKMHRLGIKREEYSS